MGEAGALKSVKHRWKSQEDREVLGSTRTLGDRDRQTGPVTPRHSIFFLEGTPCAQHSPFGGDPPKPGGVGNKPSKVQQGRAGKHKP